MIALLFLAAQAFPEKPPHVRRNADAEMAAIVRVIVDERIAARSEAPQGDYLVVVDQTVEVPREQLGESLELLLPRVPIDMKVRLVSENQNRVPLPALQTKNARIASSQTIEKIFAGKGWWQEFYHRYPDSKGFLQVSKPVFSDDRQTALIYVTHSCGGLCGTGWVMLLSREGGTWRIADKQMLWIS